MSFTEQPGLTVAQKLGCSIYSLSAIVVGVFGILFSALSHCAPNPDGSGCENDGVAKFIAFPVLPILLFIGGVLLVRHMTKDKT
ncbi:hypothetical protein [Parasphingorhabdus sp.]|uniref:hypothetical protein n=1 Tax=Parasphingorhabdus sp. TaxID=2709688 RepID=UPI001B7435D4|nr:hypothetical protein [Parasphingorhabdus sp.]MBQ0772943.1 hypothetical protein [Sphingomonadales bacterium]